MAIEHHEIGGSPIAYEVGGTGYPALALVHGFGFDMRTWNPQFEIWSELTTVLRHDLRGFGSSGPPSAPYSHHHDLLTLLDHRGLGDVHLCGHSLGGGVAVNLAIAAPSRARSLILLDPGLGGFGWDPELMAGIWDRPATEARNSDLDEARRIFFQFEAFGQARGIPEARDQMGEMIRDYSGWHWLNPDPIMPLEGGPAIDRLGEIQVPVLVILGGANPSDYHQVVEVIIEKVKDTKVIVLDGVGHVPTLEAPAAVTEAVTTWLRGLGLGP